MRLPPLFLASPQLGRAIRREKEGKRRKKTEERKRKEEEKRKKEEKKKQSEKKQMNNDGAMKDISDDVCSKCGVRYGDTGSLWICCDSCNCWLDFKCSGLNSEKKLPSKFICPDCK